MLLANPGMNFTHTPFLPISMFSIMHSTPKAEPILREIQGCSQCLFPPLAHSVTWYITFVQGLQFPPLLTFLSQCHHSALTFVGVLQQACTSRGGTVVWQTFNVPLGSGGSRSLGHEVEGIPASNLSLLLEHELNSFMSSQPWWLSYSKVTTGLRKTWLDTSQNLSSF